MFLGELPHRPLDGCHLHVDRSTAALADQMMMGQVIAERIIAQVNHPRTVSEMCVVEEALFLEGIDGAIYGRGDDVAADPLIDPIQQRGGGEVIQMGFSQDLANRPAGFGDSQSGSA